MAVGKGSILRAGNASAAVKEKKDGKAGALSTESVTQSADKITMVPATALLPVPKTWGLPVLCGERVARLRESIRTHGVLAPVLVCKNAKQELFLLKGYHRVAAAKEAGCSEIPVVFTDAASDESARKIYEEIRKFEKVSGRTDEEKEYEVVSSITVNMPSYLL